MSSASKKTKIRRAPPGAREANAALRREQLLAAAFDLFSEHGYAGTSTKRIAQAAGITEGLLFHYFPTKEALLFAVAGRHDTFAGRVGRLVAESTERTVRDFLLAIAAGIEGVSPREASFIGFMNAEAHVNPTLRASIVGATAMGIEALEALLRLRAAPHELRPDAPLATAIHGFFGGFLFFFAQHRHLAPPAWKRAAARFAREWADASWRGIATVEAIQQLEAQIDRR